MARILSQTLTHDHLPSFLPRLISSIRLRSKLPDTNNQHPSDPDLESDPIKPGSDSEVEILGGVRRLEEAIHSIVARKLAPDWLLFVPGSSYWVPPPPRRSRSAAASVEEVVGRVRKQMMSAEEEKMSLKSARGWPSKAYFVEGVLPQPVKKTPGRVVSSLSDDEES